MGGLDWASCENAQRHISLGNISGANNSGRSCRKAQEQQGDLLQQCRYVVDCRPTVYANNSFTAPQTYFPMEISHTQWRYTLPYLAAKQHQYRLAPKKYDCA